MPPTQASLLGAKAMSNGNRRGANTRWSQSVLARVCHCSAWNRRIPHPTPANRLPSGATASTRIVSVIAMCETTPFRERNRPWRWAYGEMPPMSSNGSNEYQCEPSGVSAAAVTVVLGGVFGCRDGEVVAGIAAGDAVHAMHAIVVAIAIRHRMIIGQIAVMSSTGVYIAFHMRRTPRDGFVTHYAVKDDTAC